MALAGFSAGQQFPHPAPVPENKPHKHSPITFTVVDEDGAAVPSALLRITYGQTEFSLRAETDFAGKVRLAKLVPGTYSVVAEKQGYYQVQVSDFQIASGSQIEVKLHHVEEFRESVNVTDTAPLIDPAKTASTDQLTNREIFSLPYPDTRDFRAVLPFIPSVVVRNRNEIDVAGSAGYELYQQLDSFDVTDPVTGLLNVRVSPDALRLIEVQNSRYSAEFGKGSGGVLRLESKSGDDHFRYSATNFTPGIKLSKGLEFENVTPRFNFSGPIVKGKAWWFEGLGSEYDVNINKDLPKGRNSNPLYRVDSLSKIQVNLTPANILSASFLINHQRAERAGLSLFTPPQSTVDQTSTDTFFNLRDSAYFGNKVLLETGVAGSEFRAESDPRGSLPYFLTPAGATGSFFETTASRSRRVEGLANLYLPPVSFYGRHELKLGTDFESIVYRQDLQRRPISIVDTNGILRRQSTFLGPPRFSRNNLEGSVYAQDRWSLNDHLLIEYGLRSDWDDILRDALLSPRLAATFVPGWHTTTKFNAGVGVVYDRTNLDFITRPLQGVRLDQTFAPNGITLIGPAVETTFLANTNALRAPRFVNWSLGFERMLPSALLLRVEFLEKRGRHGFSFVNQNPGALNGIYLLTSTQNSGYDALQVTAHKRFAAYHEFLISYTRSRAHSNAVLDFSLDNPTFAQQAGGPLPWDTPNHVISWGFLPLNFWQLDFAYSLDFRTGFPFNVVNGAQQIVGAPNSRRLPDFFNLNLHLERRFRLHGYEFALRGGVNNITGRKNPELINNNIDSPAFLSFSNFQRRAFTARIRFLGRK